MSVRVLGVCAGYQMLGRSVADPAGVEGPAGETEGTLNVETVLGGDKVLRPVEGREVESDLPISGYEMHIGATDGPALEADRCFVSAIGTTAPYRPMVWSSDAMCTTVRLRPVSFCLSRQTEGQDFGSLRKDQWWRRRSTTWPSTVPGT